jgi:hypothetical protein
MRARRSSFDVILGSINRQTDSIGYVMLTTTEKFTHEGYDDVNLSNDIALLKLPSMVDLTGLNSASYLNKT